MMIDRASHFPALAVSLIPGQFSSFGRRWRPSEIEWCVAGGLRRDDLANTSISRDSSHDSHEHCLLSSLEINSVNISGR